ncbi:hypothetical protein, partial [Streptomyces sp. NPDC014738]|uniref:hypothetical protein n=1 Tax=Streptomyces sp. NPDC014738 TaxID=3364901 RepID=UPI0036FDFF54
MLSRRTGLAPTRGRHFLQGGVAACAALGLALALGHRAAQLGLGTEVFDAGLGSLDLLGEILGAGLLG